MELVNFLLKHGRKEALLAELLPLQGEAGNDAALQKRIASLLLVAGAAQRAADAYRSLIEQFPRTPMRTPVWAKRNCPEANIEPRWGHLSQRSVTGPTSRPFVAGWNSPA